MKSKITIDTFKSTPWVDIKGIMLSRTSQSDGTILLHLSRFSFVQLFATLWTVAHQTPLSMGCSRQEHWSGLPFPTPGDLPSPEIESASLISPALAGRLLTTRASWEDPEYIITFTVT